MFVTKCRPNSNTYGVVTKMKIVTFDIYITIIIVLGKGVVFRRFISPTW